MEKKLQRKKVLMRRDSISEKDRKRWSEDIVEQVLQSDWYQQAEIVLSYASFRSEVVTQTLNETIMEDGKKLFLPKTYPEEHKIKFYPVLSMDSLQCGYQGIEEPQETRCVFEELESPERVLMIMPGAAYDSKGSRMGYGGGYYDRYLQNFGDRITHTMMLAYQIQEEKEIQIDAYDRKPELIVWNRKK